MKITPLEYARTLYEVTKSASREQLPEILDRFLAVVRSNRKAGKMTKIVDRFRLVWNEERHIVEAVVESRFALDEEGQQFVREFLQKTYTASVVSVRFVENESVIGGVRITVGDEVIDATMQTQFHDLRLRLLQ